MCNERKCGHGRWLRMVCMVCGCLLLGAPAPVAFAEDVPESEHGRVLRMLSAHSKKNWDGVKTWRGKLNEHSVCSYTGDRARRFLEQPAPVCEAIRAHSTEFKRISRKSVTFAVDLEHDRVYSRPKTDSNLYVDLPSGEPFSIDTEDMWHTTSDPVSIVTADCYVSFDPDMPYTMPDGSTTRVGFRYPLVKTSFNEPGVITRTFNGVYYTSASGKMVQDGITDPRAYLSVGRPTWLDLEMTAASLEQVEWPTACGVPFEIKKEGAGPQEEYQVVRRMPSGFGECLVQEMTFRADVGFNITLMVDRHPDGTVRVERRWTYKQQDGFFMPSVVEVKTFDPRDGSLNTQSTVSLIESEINQPIAPETFTERNLGLQEGDRFVDKVAKRVFVHRGGALKTLDDVDADTIHMVGASPE